MLAVAPCRAPFYNREFSNSWFSFCHGCQNSEPPRTIVIPNRSDVLKQKYLQSFKTCRVA
ncbi:hypothetical protein FUT84_11900 [Treponema phagedenis]|uniref:Uncharacterized protein n=1 Tax=Treponema phagedenis TaxID=162 RepID=A0AAE6M889_TREPH|nr:hypothetical protein FUT79_12970 [Treponema phagedenis]QEJ97277.1 hypothetical protein FUT82_04260 [Treponema phagedenis]QEK01784.1 hypothetical protein FUT84_11900 [Treponema phagedenis]QEK02531.1 hypothetical protein FUT83_01070 [Treponema phagedenis]QEK08159.1 hypothetical protein FUT81_01060 [Treponema phagedenis]